MKIDPVLLRIGKLSQTAVEAMATYDGEVNLQEMLSAVFLATDALMKMSLDASPDPETHQHNVEVIEKRIMQLFRTIHDRDERLMH